MSRGPTIGILTGGGDCPGLNAVIRAATKSAVRLGYDVVGFLRGYEGLVEPVAYMPLDIHNTAGILLQGGTILGSTNKGRFTSLVGDGERVAIDPELAENPYIFPTEEFLSQTYVFMDLTPEQNEEYERLFQTAIGN